MPVPLRCPRCRDTNVSGYGKHRVDYSTCYSCKNEFTRRDESRDIFHDLWTQAAKESNYRKALWVRLAELNQW